MRSPMNRPMQRLQRGLAAVALLAAATLWTGCFDVEETVTLQRDLSGKASFRMKVDMEPMIDIMAAVQHSMSGKEGAPTADELAQAHRAFLDKQKAAAGGDGKGMAVTAERRAELAKNLPPGLQLLDMAVDDKGTKIGVSLDLGFDNVSHLAQLSLSDKNKPAPQEGPAGNPYDQPFSGLKVVDEGATLLVTLSGADPKKRIGEQPGMKELPDPALQKQVEAALQSARFAFRLDSPFTVVDTNATRRDGHTLIWEVKASDPTASLPDTLMARFKK